MEQPLRLTPEMSSRKLLVLEFIEQYIAARGEGPSLGEIANGVGVNRNVVLKHVRNLQREGRIVRLEGPRGIRLPGQTGSERTLLNLPLVAVLDHPPVGGAAL